MVGTVADGGACVIDYDCATDTSICDDTTMKCGPDTSTAARVVSDGVSRHTARLLHSSR
jgi:hypothetical protein